MIKNKIIVFFTILSMILGGFSYFIYNQLTLKNKELKIANIRISSEINKNEVYQITIEELQHSKDSIDLKVNSLIKELKVKPKKIVETVYIQSDFIIKDTVTLMDTLFLKDYSKEIGDKWYTLKLDFKYPNQFISNIKFKNEVIAIVHEKRVTVKPEKKFFICRWLQKKQTVQTIEVKELNPYSMDSNFKFIKIIK